MVVWAYCRVPEENRLQNANSFEDTSAILWQTRSGVAWQAVGVMLAAYEIALAYAKQREQFGRPIGSRSSRRSARYARVPAIR